MKNTVGGLSLVLGYSQLHPNQWTALAVLEAYAGQFPEPVIPMQRIRYEPGGGKQRKIE